MPPVSGLLQPTLVRLAFEKLVPAIGEEAALSPLPGDIQDDRGSIKPGDPVFLIVEDDILFARVLLDITREHGFKG